MASRICLDIHPHHPPASQVSLAVLTPHSSASYPMLQYSRPATRRTRLDLCIHINSHHNSHNFRVVHRGVVCTTAENQVWRKMECPNSFQIMDGPTQNHIYQSSVRRRITYSIPTSHLRHPRALSDSHLISHLYRH